MALRKDRNLGLAAVRGANPLYCLCNAAAPELLADKNFFREAVKETKAWWLVKVACEELQEDKAFVEELKALSGRGLVFTYYDSYDCFQQMRSRFPATGASIPGGEAYEEVMKQLRATDHGSTWAAERGSVPLLQNVQPASKIDPACGLIR